MPNTTSKDTRGAVHLAVAYVIAIVVLWQLSNVLLLTLGAVLVAILLSRGSRGIQKLLPIGYVSSLILLILSFSCLVALGIITVAPEIINQAKDFSIELPAIMNDVRQMPSRFGISLEGVGLEQIGSSASTLFGTAKSILASTTNGIAQFAAIILVGFFFALSPKHYIDRSLLFVPKAHRKQVAYTLERVSNMLWSWLIGRGAAMLAVAILVGIGLVVIDMPFVLLLATIAGVLNFIPTIGPLLASVPAMLIAVSLSPTMLGYVIILYITVQIIENNMITPFVQMHMVKMGPATTVLAQLIVAILFGPIAVTLAVPLTVLLQVIAEEYWIKKVG